MSNIDPAAAPAPPSPVEAGPSQNTRVQVPVQARVGSGESTLELSSSWEESQLFRSTNPSNGHYKPFNRGEHNYYAMVDADNDPSNGKEYEG